MNQRQWETDAYAEGMEKFFNQEAADRRDGKMDSTAVGSSVIRQRVLEVGAKLAEQAARKTRGIGGAYVAALRVAATRHDGDQFYQDYNIPAYIGLLTMLQAMYAKSDKGKFLSQLSVEIGRRLEYDQQLYVFRQDNPGFVAKIEQSLNEQNVTSLRHRLKTYQKKWRDSEMKWEDWGTVKRAQVGIRVIKAVLTEMDDCFILTKKHDGKHARHYIDTTLEFDDFVVAETDLLSKTMPIMRPMIEPPLDWERHSGETVGGFHTMPLRRASPFIKTKGQEHRDYVDSAYPWKHMQAVNHMQRTAWEVNQPVLDALRQFIRLGITFDTLPRGERLEPPPHPGDDVDEERFRQWLSDCKRVHGINKQNQNELIILNQSLTTADMLGDRPFWFAYTCDFRGRIYCTSTTLSPQGPDHIKALIRFREGKRLGREGIRWTAINGANKYGEDKLTYNDRVRWVLDNEERIQEVVENTTGSRARSFLQGADKPFQFLAFCFEWAAADYGRNPDATGFLPVGLDGSCNGLQHYAALLRDPRGGASVNLTDAPLPEDVYGEVAEEFRKLVPAGDSLGAKFHARPTDRKLSKRPVMTLPYGATQQSCRQYIREYIKDNALAFGVVDNDKAQWELAVYATPYMWQAIANVVVAARAGMDWLQKCSSIVAKSGVYARWLSPVDFPVYQHYSKYEDVTVSTDLFGRIRLTLQGAACGIQAFRARNGVAPNYVHSLDSSHMVLTILECERRGIGGLAMIHDDFGTHAADTAELFDLIRITFVRMYCQRDWLLVWKKEMERLHEDVELPDPPQMGDLDILDVLESKYFFG